MIALLIALASAPSAPPAPSAHELLGQVRAAYRQLDHYRDRGEIEVIGRDRVVRSSFTTAAAPGGRFRLALDGDRQILWRDGVAAFRYDRASGRSQRVRSLAAELGSGLGLDPEALALPALLLGEDAILLEPDAASVEGPQPCAEARCWLLALSRLGGTLEYRLWVDVEDRLIRRVEIDRPAPQQILARALGRAEPAARGTTIRVTVRSQSLDPIPETELGFGPPPAVAVGEDGSPGAEVVPDNGRFGEVITVRLASIVVRVVDRTGAPILGLGPDDFELAVGGRQVPVKSVEWVSSAAPEELPLSELAAAGAVVDPPGKLVVFFVQSDFHPVRARGHLRMLDFTERILRALARDDHAAVVSFDSHLKLRRDFTRDRERIQEALFDGVRHGKAPRPEPGVYPSLARHLDFEAARRAATPEAGLEVTARALGEFPGEKVVIFLGWGLGRFGAGGVRMTRGYRQALEALREARAAVFVLDVTDADYHSLELGLESVALDTGGTYEKTHLFPGSAAERLARSISGHYLLFYEPEPSAEGRLRVRLRDAEGRILIQPTG